LFTMINFISKELKMSALKIKPKSMHFLNFISYLSYSL